jgi:mono/diheme cytochrome c family protein
MKKLIGIIAVGILVLLVAIQVVPYGRTHSNPPVRREPAWDSPETRAIAVRACFDCHSNQTTWPWYSNIAPISWLVQRDVEEGRRKLNVSEWDRPQEEASESAKSVRKGTMPPWYYLWAHLSAAEREVLIRGLAATLGQPEGKAGKSSERSERGRGSHR